MEQETAETWIVQYRIKSKSASRWGAWAVWQDYLTEEQATKRCGDMRRAAKKYGLDKRADEEWRVLHVTQEVVY